MKTLTKQDKDYLILGACFAFLSLYPVFHFYTQNYYSLEIHYLFAGIITVLIPIFAFTFLLFLISRKLCFSFYLSSALGIMFYFINPKTASNFGIFLIIPLILCILYLLHIAGTKKPFKDIITVISIILAVFICFDFISVLLKTKGGVRNNFKNSVSSISEDKFQNNKEINSEIKRDIYIIMLDMYPGETSLKELFNYDNSNFAYELQKRGFYVFNNIYANYSLTSMALPTMLNMNYVEDLNFKNRFDAINNAEIFKLAQQSGRKTVYFNHSSFFRPVKPKNTTMINGIMSRKIYRHNLDEVYNYSYIYLKCNYSVWKRLIKENNELNPFVKFKDEVVKYKEPKLVFAHIEMPHCPYFFDENGNKQTDSDKINYKIDGEKFLINEDGFLPYLKFTNKEVLKFIDYIFENSEVKPIVLISGDHGIRTNYYEKSWKKHLDESLNDKVNVYSKLATFGAYYNPDDKTHNIKKAKSLVNLYRLFSNETFNTNYNIIKDKHAVFFYTNGCKYDFKCFQDAKTFSNKEFKKLYEPKNNLE